MHSRTLGRTGREVSVIGLGTWQLGADWGDVSESDALEVLGASVESGVTFFDTADVYGDGRSEKVISTFRAANRDVPLTVATKMGRRLDQLVEGVVDGVALEHGSRRTVQLHQVERVHAEVAARAVGPGDEVLADVVRRHLVEPTAHLGRDGQRHVGVRRAEAADDLLAATVAVHVGGVEEGDPGLDGGAEHLERVALADVAPVGTELPGAESDDRDGAVGEEG